MFWALWINEEKKMMKRRLIWIGILLFATIIALNIVAMANSIQNAEINQRYVVWPMALVITLGQFAANPIGAGFLLVAIASTATAQEYTWHTYHAYLGRGVSRYQILAAKFLALLIPALLTISVAMVATTVVSGYYTIKLNGFLDFTQVDFLQMGIAILLGVFALLPYGALAILLSVIGRSLVLPMIGGLSWILVELVSWQFLYSFGELGITIAQWMPIGANMGLMKSSMTIARSVPETIAGFNAWEGLSFLPPQAAAVVVAGYTLILLVISVIIFYRQDLSS